jgi:hypothetical protein
MVAAVVGQKVQMVIRGRSPYSEDTNTVWYFNINDPSIVGGGTASLENFAQGLWKEYRDLFVVQLQPAGWFTNQIDVKVLDTDTGLFNLQAIYFVPTADKQGGRDDASLPASGAYRLMFVRPPGTSFRNGYKRLPGVCEADTNVDDILATPLGVLQTLAIALSIGVPAVSGTFGDDEEVLNGTIMDLQVIQAVLDGDILPVPNFAPPAAIIANGKVGHQDTRDPGRGG